MADTAACRILILSSSVDRAQQFVQRVKTLSSEFSGAIDATPNTNTSDAASTTIPWTISNKYYTADVHFETRELHTFATYHASEVPAVIYVWDRGEPYKEHVPAIATKLRQHDPEVSLAVRFSGAVRSAEEEEEGLDEFLSTHGFEYVDGDRSGRRPTRDGEGFSDEDSSGVPGLPRVIDALSTIMWPSIVQSATTSARKSRARELLDWAREEEADDGLRALISTSPQDSTLDEGSARKSRMQREMDELERWLAEDDAGRSAMDDAQAWKARGIDDDAAGWQDMPTPTIRTPAEDPSAPFGFEDDFAEFVGAPLDVAYGHDAVRQEPMHTGASYRSLASAPELAEDFLGDGDGEDDDADLPSRTEIAETSRRIFGAASLDVPSRASARRSPSARATSLPAPAAAESSGEAQSPQAVFRTPDDDSFASFAEEDDDDFELGAFDLSRVLGALQGMKEEIAGMTDEDERRKAAARVALGLVYGLRKEDERERGMEEFH